jgi:hypothetical protein
MIHLGSRDAAAIPPVGVMRPGSVTASIDVMSADLAGPDGKSHSDKLTKVTLMASAALITLLVTLIVGIAIGNVTRKKIDRMSHGYS